ncbi:hypothetical protein MPSEU_000213500 [Mayamaea pseudoterrestris]|nr:hypothetical protein MPSEU_000213500 [Mayamaea pseudoterrestris]
MSKTSIENPVEVIDDDDEDEGSVDQEQLDEYRDALEQLGNKLDKAEITALSVIAEDFADSLASAKALYNVIRERLMSASRDSLIPIVYVIDSVLKNKGGKFIEIIQEDAQEWMPMVYGKLTPPMQQKLQRVYKTWQDSQIFTPQSLKVIGRCFSITSNNPLGSTRIVAGIPVTADGTLVLPAPLRREMQAVLDAMQSDKTNELEKVSLERLADIGPEILANIKTTAQDNMNAAATSQNGGNYGHEHFDGARMKPAYLQFDTRSPAALQLEKEWADLSWDVTKATPVIHKLRYQPSPDVDVLYTQQEAQQMTIYLGVAQALSTVLQTTLERVQQNEECRTMQKSSGGGAAAIPANSHQHQFRAYTDKSLFTNAGVKQRNDMAIGYLYQVGLPFVSSSDGRRFATQLELSQHLDALFKRNQLEKSMARTEERGWTMADSIWTRSESESPAQTAASTLSGVDFDSGQNTEQPDDVYPADEARSRCVICGINFKMFFDNENGMYMYRNCCEKPVENDEAAEEQTSLVLVHVTCWKALGSPILLTMDQALLTNRE